MLLPQTQRTAKIASSVVPLSGQRVSRPPVLMCPISTSMALRHRKSFASIFECKDCKQRDKQPIALDQSGAHTNQQLQGKQPQRPASEDAMGGVASGPQLGVRRRDDPLAGAIFRQGFEISAAASAAAARPIAAASMLRTTAITTSRREAFAAASDAP